MGVQSFIFQQVSNIWRWSTPASLRTPCFLNKIVRLYGSYGSLSPPHTPQSLFHDHYAHHWYISQSLIISNQWIMLIVGTIINWKARLWLPLLEAIKSILYSTSCLFEQFSCICTQSFLTFWMRAKNLDRFISISTNFNAQNIHCR